MPLILRLSAFGGIRTRVHTQPQGRESNKDSRPVRSTTDSYEGGRADDVNSLHDWSPVRTRFQVAPTG